MRQSCGANLKPRCTGTDSRVRCKRRDQLGGLLELVPVGIRLRTVVQHADAIDDGDIESHRPSESNTGDRSQG